PESAFDTMWTATSPTPFADFPFGRVHPSMLMIDWCNGWFLGDIAGHPAPNAGCGGHGYLARMFLVPDAILVVVTVGNRLATDEYYAADIAADVLGMLLEECSGFRRALHRATNPTGQCRRVQCTPARDFLVRTVLHLQVGIQPYDLVATGGSSDAG